MAERYNADEVQALADEFIRFKRYVEDVLENLDVNNFADGAWKKMVTKFGDVSSAGFEAYADAEKAIARMFAEYKKDVSNSLASIEAIADANGASIKQLVTWQGNVDTSINDLQIRDSTLAESISKIEQTANGNGATIASLVEWKGDAQKSAASIEQIADANGAFVSMFAVASPLDIDASKGYIYDKATNKYIFKNSNGENVDVYPSDFAGIYINAMNNNYSEIRLNAKTIAFGNYASVDENGWLKITRLWDSQSKENYYAKLYSQEGDFGIYHKDADDYANPLSSDCMWGVYNSIDGITFSTRGNQYLVRSADGKMKPKGEWDFSSCSVSNIPLYFS